MKRDDFLKQDDVRGFIDWLAAELPVRPFHLKMARSRFVPGGLDVQATGLEAVLGHYVWSTRWTDAQGKAVVSGNWHETRASLGLLRDWLKDAIARQDEDQALAACLAILEWGGVRGAIVFLKRLHAQGRLVAYFTRLAPLMSLDSDAALDALDTDSVERFDAGLTKIHALFDDSGSPIYDSRVGAAMAMLYAQYRSQAGKKLARNTGWPSLRAPRAASKSAIPRGSTAALPVHRNSLARPYRARTGRNGRSGWAGSCAPCWNSATGSRRTAPTWLPAATHSKRVCSCWGMTCGALERRQPSLQRPMRKTHNPRTRVGCRPVVPLP